MHGIKISVLGFLSNVGTKNSKNLSVIKSTA
jgi:hypothetical protein